jgi:DNA-binding beta-propeller fold protein YncE
MGNIFRGMLLFLIVFPFTACNKDPIDSKKVISKNETAFRSCDFVVTTLAGTGLPGYVDGAPAVAQFFYVYGICLKQGSAYLTEYAEQRIRSISPAGTVSTFTSTPGSVLAFLHPRDICYDPVSNCFYATDHHRILKIDSAGTVSVHAGNVLPGYFDHIAPKRARFNGPEGICVDNSGNIYVADRGNHCIRKIYPTGQVITLAGTGTVPGYVNGGGPIAKFNNPFDICYKPGDNFLLVTDEGNNRIRKIQMNGVTSHFAGSGVAGDVDGSVFVAKFLGMKGIAVDLTGDVLVVQAGGSPLRSISANMVTTIIPDNGTGYTNGYANVAQFNSPRYIVVNSANQYLISDFNNYVIRRVSCQ